MKNKISLYLNNIFKQKVYKETPLLFLTEPADSDDLNEDIDYVYVKSKLHLNNNYLLMIPYKSVCREI